MPEHAPTSRTKAAAEPPASTNLTRATLSHDRRFRKHSDLRITDHGRDCPSGKWGYSTLALARQEIANLIKEQGIAYHLNAYKCPHCRSWHMTSKEQG